MFFLFLSNSVLAAEQPNLTLYQSTGWSDKIVVSNIDWTITDNVPTAVETAYITVMVANLGTISVQSSFALSIYVDDRLLGDVQIVPSPSIKVMSGKYASYSIGKLCVGDHTVRVDIDNPNVIDESDESDNSYTRSFSVTLAGTEIEKFKVCPAENDFGAIVVLNQNGNTFLVTNNGCDILDISGVSISGSESDLYSITSDGCSGQSLFSANGINSYPSTCTVDVSFTPDSPGEKTAFLNIQSSDADSPNYQIPLSGEGVLGDFDGDESVKIDDVISVLQLAAGAVLTVNLDSDSDINGDGRLGLQDVVYVMNGIALHNSSPVYDVVKVRTSFGELMVWLHDLTPLHRDNFLSLAKQGFYDGLIFHRVIDGFMIQGGDPLGTGSGGPGYTIPAEINSSLTHVYGAVAAARLGDEVNPQKNSSGSQFYIVENRSGTPQLDMGYTVFGQVIDGMPIVEAIATVPKNSSDKPLQDVVMTKVEVVSLTARQLLDQYGFIVPGS